MRDANAIVTVYDYMSFSIVGRKVIFRGFTMKPQNKTLAEKVAKNLSWVEEVQNEIQVMPLGGGGRDIRRSVYALLVRRIPRAFPTGHAYIRIGVEHGNVTLVGVIDQIDNKMLEAAVVSIKHLPLVKEVANNIVVRPKS